MDSELLFEVPPGLDGEDASVCFLTEHVLGSLGSMTTFEKCEGPEDFLLFIVELLRGQVDVERAGVQKRMVIVTFFTEVRRTGKLGTCSSRCRNGGQRHWRRWYRQRRCVCYEQREGLATSYVSCCSCVVKVASVVLMLFSEMFCLSVSSWRWCCRYPKVSAMSWRVSGGNDIWKAEFPEGWV